MVFNFIPQYKNQTALEHLLYKWPLDNPQQLCLSPYPLQVEECSQSLKVTDLKELWYLVGTVATTFNRIPVAIGDHVQ